MKRNIFRGLAVLLAAIGLFAVPQTAERAEAYDAYPCHSPTLKTFHWAGYTYPNWEVRYCPLVSGLIPVYGQREAKGVPVGYLNGGDSRNWFVLEREGLVVHLNGYYNKYWASTMADNGAWGYVPEVYFRGGGNNEDDRGLLFPGPLTCGGSCAPIPPWWY